MHMTIIIDISMPLFMVEICAVSQSVILRAICAAKLNHIIRIAKFFKRKSMSAAILIYIYA